MGPTRRFPLDEPAAGPLHARSESDRAQVAATAPAERWPVLARIAELSRGAASAPPAAELAPPAEPTAARTTYRVDAPHNAAPSPTQAAAPAPPQAKPLPRSAAPSPAFSTAPAAVPTQAKSTPDRILRAAPLPIRVALEAWQWIQPHHQLIRFAAMLTLMAAGGMAMVMIMSERRPSDASPSAPPTTAAVAAVATANSDHSKTAGPQLSEPQLSESELAEPELAVPAPPELEIQHAELQPALTPAAGPAAETDTLAPTAAGPLPPPTMPLMAVETAQPRPVLPYPTTVRPEPLDPIIAAGVLPQAQFSEPTVARLKGTVEDSQVR